MTDDHSSYDYIVVGAGSAGAIVAARLTEEPDTTVLLLEAGPEDDNMWSKVPLGFAKILFDPDYMWTIHQTDPEPALNGKQYGLPHGRLIGGSSAINGLVHVRGSPLDYDSWRDMGCEGWGYRDVLPYFRKSERDHRGPGEYHGGDGPIGVEHARWQTPLAEAFIQTAMRVLDIPRNEDFNGPDMSGAGYWDLATWHGRRSSTSLGYIRPNRDRPNLDIRTHALATRIGFEGRTARYVEYERGGEAHRAEARREVILSAGALQTPQLLQLSGVGPGDLLREHGIEVVHDLGGVGENLIDHMQIGRKYTTSSRDTLNVKVGSPLSQLAQGIEYYLGPRRGPLTIGASLAGAYVRTAPEVEAPDVHLHFLPFMPGDKGWDLARFSGFRLGLYQNRPKSRGHARIRSADPHESPSFVFNHLTDEEDVRAITAGMRLAKRVGDAMPRRYDVEEIEPGPDGDSDDGLLDYIRTHADTAFHFCGTARMGADDGAVVDSELRVLGMERLRVIDASVMPTIVSGNINAAVLMIGEKGADMVRAAQA